MDVTNLLEGVSISEQNRKRLDQIKQVVNSRRNTFNDVTMGLAFHKLNSNEFELVFVRFLLCNKWESNPEDILYEYDDFLIIRKTIGIDESLEMLEDVLAKDTTSLDGYSFMTKVEHLSYDLHESNVRYGYYRGEWPYVYVYGRLNLQSSLNNPLVKSGLPLFPNWGEAVATLFGVHSPHSHREIVPRFEVIVPDFRARIKRLHLSGAQVQIEIETKEIDEKQLVAKFFCRTDNNQYTSDDLSVQDGSAIFNPEEIPDEVEVHILSKLDGESIDRKRYDIRYPSRGVSVITKDIETRLVDLIDRGESKTLEFKEKLNRERPKELLETIVSFSNTEGGTILLGVDDKCRVVGFKEDVEETILNWIAEYCDPPIEVKINQDSIIKEKEIVLIEVDEGNNKPYNLKGHGIYVRKGPSDRLIKRTELDEMYENKKRGISY